MFNSMNRLVNPYFGFSVIAIFDKYIHIFVSSLRRMIRYTNSDQYAHEEKAQLLNLAL